MASKFSVLYTCWQRPFHAAVHAASAALLTIENEGSPDIVGVRAKAEEIRHVYQNISLSDANVTDMACIAREGLVLGDILLQLCDSLRLAKGHEFFELCEEIMDHAEVIALSFNAKILTELRRGPMSRPDDEGAKHFKYLN